MKLGKKSKIIIWVATICVVIVVAPILYIYIVFTTSGERSYEEQYKVVTEDFGVDVIFWSGGGGRSWFETNYTNNRRRFFFGTRNGEDVLIVYPMFEPDKSYVAQLNLNIKFEDMVTLLNSTEKGVICTEKDRDKFRVSGNIAWIRDGFNLPEDLEYDVEVFFIYYSNYLIFQQDGKCVIYKSNNTLFARE